MRTDAELRVGAGRKCQFEDVLVRVRGRRRQDAAGPRTAELRTSSSAAGPRYDVIRNEREFGRIAAETSHRCLGVY